MAGLAPNEVLIGRLRRAAPQAAALPLDRPDVEEPAWAALLDAVTVQETRLFRHPAQLAAFRVGKLPALAAAARAAGRKLRLVSAGCATGEEAWTLAAIAAPAGVAAAVTGLDICRPALAAAARGRYAPGPPDALRDVPAADRALLVPGDGVVGPVAALRPMVGFRRANLLAPGLTAAGADAILCRNVLIYLTDPARRRVLRALAAALRPGGVLLLGPTDAVPRDLGLVPAGEATWQREGSDA